MTESSSDRSHQCFCIETFKLSTLWTALEVIQQEILHTNWWYVFTELLQILLTTFTYIWTIYELVYKGLKYENIPHHNLDQWARVQVYHLAQTFKLWELPHYRAPSYQADLIANLKNVAIPGTGIPLSWFCTNYYVAFAFICLGNPIICFVGALKTEIEKAFCETSTQSTSVDVNSPIGKKFYLEAILLESFKTYLDYLLHPTDWFNLWRLNSSVVALHSHVTKATSNSYDQENKWEFIKHGLKLGVPVTPIITDIETIVCKHKNVEGGMGIYFYDNANCGGDWIIQKKLHNSCWLQKLLPDNAPLSTMRIITSSKYSLDSYGKDKSALGVPGRGSESTAQGKCAVDVMVAPEEGTNTEESLMDSGTESEDWVPVAPAAKKVSINAPVVESVDPAIANAKECPRPSDDPIKIETCVLRLGMKNALTDHSAIFFDVCHDEYPVENDTSKLGVGVILQGCTNKDWYELGIQHNAVAKLLLKLAYASGMGWVCRLVCSFLGCSIPPEKDGMPNSSSFQKSGFTKHPDVSNGNSTVTGQRVPDMTEAMKIVKEAHIKMMPDVPLVGWDVAFTRDGIFLLEVNLSCNFFMGKLDIPSYIDLLDAYWTELDKKIHHC